MAPGIHRRSAVWRAMIGIGVGILVTPPALFLGFRSAGGGHGDYLWANVFFPYSVVLMGLLSGEPGPLTLREILVMMVLPCIQFPLYGVLIGLSASSMKKPATVAAMIGIIHVAAVAACFLGCALQEAEQAAEHAAFIKRYDADGDGMLSPEERQTAVTDALEKQSSESSGDREFR